MNRAERVLEYMREFGSITPMEAFSDLGITKLATRVSELKRQGYEFDQEVVQTKNRYGENAHFMKYRLKENHGRKNKKSNR